MNAAITRNEQMFISCVLEHGYLPNNLNGGFGINDVALMLFPQDNDLGYSDDDYRAFRTSINQLDQQAAPSNKRYVFVNRTDDTRRDAMDALFNEAFKTNPNAIVAAAEELSGTKFYSSWKKAFVIDLPKMAGQFLSHFVVKLAVAVATFFAARSSLYSLYAFSTVSLHSTVMPALSFIITRLPPQALFIVTYATEVFNFIRDNPLTCLFGTFVVTRITHYITENPNSPLLLRRVARIVNQIADFIFGTCWAIYWPVLHHGMIGGNAFETAVTSYNLIDSIAEALKNHADSSGEQRLRIRKEKAYAVWMRIVEKGKTPALIQQIAV